MMGQALWDNIQQRIFLGGGDALDHKDSSLEIQLDRHHAVIQIKTIGFQAELLVVTHEMAVG